MKLHPNSPENCISSGLSSKKRRPSSDRIGRRLIAMLLVTAMAMGMSVGLLASVDDQLYPTAVQSVEEFPTLTIETNLVKSELTGEPEIEVVEDANGVPTGEKYGFVEVALRVKPGLNGSDLIPFYKASVALAYEKNILEPITWNYDGDGTDETEKLDTYDLIFDPAATPIDPLTVDPLSVNFPAKKVDAIHTGAAFVGGVDEGTDGDTDTEDYVAFSLYAEAQQPTFWSGNRAPVMLEGDSRLVVVRFRYDATKYEMTYDETNQKILITELTGGTDITDTTPLVTWANDSNAAASTMWDNAHYVGGEDGRSEMYYIHAAADPALWTDTDSDGQLDPPTSSDCYFLQAVLPDTSGGTTTTTFSLREELTDDPYYVGRDAYSVSGDTYTTWSTRAATGTYSYTTNFFPVEDDWWAAMWPTVAAADREPKLRFTQICALTADQGTGGISLDDIAVVLFYDWDDTLLGTLLIPRGMDVREDVNAYVRDNFIHPDLRYDAAGVAGSTDTALIDGTSRTNSYRGTFPHAAPGDAEFSGTEGTDHVLDGDKYPLTNKLDYTFFKRAMTLDETTGVWSFNGGTGVDADYPYANGWQVVADTDAMEDVWTTFGVGELENYKAADGAFTPGADAAYFDVEDFLAVDDAVLYVKALYEPGAEMSTSAYYSPTVAHYTRYTQAASTGNSAYSISFAYRRVASDNLGVRRGREPTIRFGLVPDLMAVDAQSSAGITYMEVLVDNDDYVEVDLTPSGTIYEIGYQLINKYGSNFMGGYPISAGDELNVPTNWNYADYTYANRLGSAGFIFTATMNMLLEKGSTVATQAEFNAYITKATLDDLNFKWLNGAEFARPAFITQGQMRLYNTIKKALADPTQAYVDPVTGYAKLTWHQLQYGIINNGALVAPGVAATQPYTWYRGPV